MTILDQMNSTPTSRKWLPWNKGKLTGAKPPLRPKHVWSIRTKLQIDGRARDLAMFNLAIDSKLRGCDVVAIRVEDVAAGGYTADRATVRQRKTGQPVRFELSEQSRQETCCCWQTPSTCLSPTIAVLPDGSTTFRAAACRQAAKPKGRTQTNISNRPLQPRDYGAIGRRVCKSLRIARLAAAAARCLSVCPLTIEPSEKIFSSRNSSNLASAYSAAAITQ